MKRGRQGREAPPRRSHVVFCASFDEDYAKPGKAEWLRRLGTVSFSLYLCHRLAFLLARGLCLLARDLWSAHAAWLNVWSIGLGLGLTVAFTALSFQTVEAPARRLGRRVRFSRSSRPGVARNALDGLTQR